jgi:hypothetical protein
MLLHYVWSWRVLLLYKVVNLVYRDSRGTPKQNLLSFRISGAQGRPSRCYQLDFQRARGTARGLIRDASGVDRHPWFLRVADLGLGSPCLIVNQSHGLWGSGRKAIDDLSNASLLSSACAPLA